MRMIKKLTVLSYVAYVFILAATGLHVAGLLTENWFAGTSDNTEVTDVHLGLWKHFETFSNGTEVETVKSNLRKEEQFIVMAIIGVNALMCFTVLFKNIHVVVGLISFIILSLMILCGFYTYDGINSQRKRIQGVHSNWPELKLSWSFFLVFVGIILNIVSTLIFLTSLLIKGEIKASKSSRGLGPADVQSDKTPIISSISGKHGHDNYAHDVEAEHAYDRPDSTSGHAFPHNDAIMPDPDYMEYENSISSNNAATHYMQPNNSKSSHISNNYTVDSVDLNDRDILESSRL